MPDVIKFVLFLSPFAVCIGILAYMACTWPSNGPVIPEERRNPTTVLDAMKNEDEELERAVKGDR